LLVRSPSDAEPCGVEQWKDAPRKKRIEQRVPAASRRGSKKKGCASLSAMQAQRQNYYL